MVLLLCASHIRQDSSKTFKTTASPKKTQAQKPMRQIYIIYTLIALTISIFLSGCGQETKKVEDFDFTTFQKRLAPRPQHFEFYKGFFDIKDGCKIDLCMPKADEAAEKIAQEKFVKFWKAIPQISLKEDASAQDIRPEGYRITADSDVLKISAPDTAGLLNALKTLRQLADAKPLGKTLHGYIIPLCNIEDWPALKLRAIQLGLPITNLTRCF